ncbi:diguanylate cyclase/phosphodiesterase (GGDEF & EAL domain) with PAS/PAC sensor(s) [Alkalibacterium sp. AK22]|nr:diguanylate cyclase/phosphodiesterase (GGDEF & EAL domain) with PAS/PAC sensor(s) [Alkalibacterium sp. AK22]
MFPVQQLRKQYDIQAAQEHRAEARDTLNQIQNELQSKLDSSLFYADFFEMLISQDSDLTDDDFLQYAQLVVDNNQIIDSVSIARDGIIQFIYPLRGNDRAIGFDLLEDTERAYHIQKAIEQQKSVAQGPIEAVQGGVKIFNRKPVFIESAGGLETLWGFANITVDYDDLLASVVDPDTVQDYALALRLYTGTDREEFWGDARVFEQDSLLGTVRLPGNVWTLGITPAGGWRFSSDTHQTEMLLFYVMISMIALMVYVFTLQYVNKRELAHSDSLTGLLNKGTFEKTVRQLIKANTGQNGLLLIDFNDFKQVNDEYGHLAGDRVLIVCSRRITEVLKQTDQIGRIGGDEFMILVKDVRSEENLEKIADRIVRHVEQPIEYKGCLIKPSVSIGYMMTTQLDLFENLYESVDKQMYRHKSVYKRSADFMLTEID